MIFLEYSIGEFSQLTGLGVHTLRYYEHEGLLAPERDVADRRRYSDKDLAWVEFIKRLKNTGMPIKKIQHYAKLRAEGDTSLRERMELLTKHRETLERQMELLREHMDKLDDKIKLYREKLNK